MRICYPAILIVVNTTNFQFYPILGMLSASDWANNSPQFVASKDDFTEIFSTYICLITAVLILTHRCAPIRRFYLSNLHDFFLSAILHKLKFNRIRFYTDGGCWSTVGACTCLFIGSVTFSIIEFH